MHAAQTESGADATVLMEPDDPSEPGTAADHPVALGMTRRSDGLTPTVFAPSRLLNTTDVLELAMYTFGDLSTAQAWMQEPQANLGGSPAQMCRQPDGAERVLQLLYAIASGTEP